MERAALGSTVLVRLGDEVWDGDCVNISMSGALVDLYSPRPIKPDHLLGRSGALLLEHRSGGERLEVEAGFSVARVAVPGQYPRPTRVGLRFHPLDQASSMALYRIIRWQGWV
jgi:hypothetical protein